MKKLGVAVVGAGFWGRNHARTFSQLEQAKLLAICDRNLERVGNVSSEFGVTPYTDTCKMLKREDIEAVSICTWSTSLAEEALRALEAGKHVLVEKPMASSAEEAERIVKVSEERGLILTVGFLTRFIPRVQNVKEMIENKTIGELVCAVSKRVSTWPERIGDVGVIKDLAIHDIDLMRYFFNEDPVAVYARTGSMRHGKFEDYAHIMLAFDGGRSAFIESNWLTPNKTRTLTITGSEAIVKLNYSSQQLLIKDKRGAWQPNYPAQKPLRFELQHFVDCALENKKPLITGTDGIKALKIAEAALKSSVTDNIVKLK